MHPKRDYSGKINQVDRIFDLNHQPAATIQPTQSWYIDWFLARAQIVPKLGWKIMKWNRRSCKFSAIINYSTMIWIYEHIFFIKRYSNSFFPSMGEENCNRMRSAKKLCKARNQWSPRHFECHQIPGGKIEVKTYIRLKASRLPVIERHCPLVDVSAVVVFFYISP